MSEPMLNPWVVVVLFFALMIALQLIFLATRYRRCPPDSLLVIYGKVGGVAARCIHGGGTLIWPLIQGYAYLSLAPLPVRISLQDLFQIGPEPGTFTVGISKDPNVMPHAVDRLLHRSRDEIAEVAENAIQGQLYAMASMPKLGELLKNVDDLLDEMHQRMQPELHKLGLSLLTINLGNVVKRSTEAPRSERAEELTLGR